MCSISIVTNWTTNVYTSCQDMLWFCMGSPILIILMIRVTSAPKAYCVLWISCASLSIDHIKLNVMFCSLSVLTHILWQWGKHVVWHKWYWSCAFLFKLSQVCVVFVRCAFWLTCQSDVLCVNLYCVLPLNYSVL